MKHIMLVANTDWYLYNFRLALAHQLQEHAYQVTLVSPQGAYVTRLKSDGIRWIPWQVGRQTLAPWKELSSILKLAHILRSEQPDLVHNHTMKAVLYGSIAARLANVKRVVNTISGRGYLFIDNRLTTRLLRTWLKLLMRVFVDQSSHVTIFENDSDLHYFQQQKLLSTTLKHVIHGVGVDLTRFSPVPEPDGTPIILFAGRILWDKGVGVLVKAAQELHRKTKVRVVLVGKPDAGNPSSISESQIKEWVDQGVVEWWGWQEDMSMVYPQCHVVVLPSMGEGMPTVLLEAAACGRAVVATDVPGCRQVIVPGVTGYLVPPEDANALASALYTLLNDQVLRQKMGVAGRKMMEAKFDIETINSQTLYIYQELLT